MIPIFVFITILILVGIVYAIYGLNDDKNLYEKIKDAQKIHHVSFKGKDIEGFRGLYRRAFGNRYFRYPRKYIYPGGNWYGYGFGYPHYWAPYYRRWRRVSW